MPSTSADALAGLLAELAAGHVVPERYSRRSLYGRCEPTLITAVLAMVAVLGSVLLCELTAEHPGAGVRAGAGRRHLRAARQ